ncbi:sulfotransferase [Nanoarchaeota archaeon]
MRSKTKPVFSLKNILTGRRIPLIDGIIFRLFGRKKNGWLIGNRLRNKFHGEKNYVSKLPILFVGGCPRGGTSLLQNMLKTIEGINGPYIETCLFQDIKRSEVVKEAFDIDKRDFLELYSKSKGEVVLLSELILKKYQKEKKIKLTVLKAPKYILFVEDIFRYFPDSKFINVIRDGRDTTISMEKFFLRQLGEKYPFSYNVKTWVVSINQGKKFRKLKDKYLEVRYEDIIQDPHKMLSKIARFLGRKAPTKKQVSNYYKKLNISKISKFSISHSVQLSKPVYKKSMGRWKKEMSKEQKAIFKKYANRELKELGYVGSNNW